MLRKATSITFPIVAEERTMADLCLQEVKPQSVTSLLLDRRKRSPQSLIPLLRLCVKRQSQGPFRDACSDMVIFKLYECLSLWKINLGG